MQFKVVNKIPAGAVQIHWLGTSVQTSMAPRGSLEKESLGLYVLERLESNLEHWMDPQYADSVGEWEGVEALVGGARAELEAAIAAFLKNHSER